MQYRQGAVFIVRVQSIPEGVRPVDREHGRIILAHGEVTGHSHAIAERDAELFSGADTTDRFLRIMAASGVALQHEEHSTITLPPGDYVIRIQREYTSKDMAPIRVAD
jgi:hypothetical protein